MIAVYQTFKFGELILSRIRFFNVLFWYLIVYQFNHKFMIQRFYY